MAQNDPYLPSPVEVTDGNNATFDASSIDPSTGVAIVSDLKGTFDATIFIDAWDGSTWQQVTQLTDENGNTTFFGDWHSQYNRIYVGADARRLRIENGSGVSGWCAVDGDER